MLANAETAMDKIGAQVGGRFFAASASSFAKAGFSGKDVMREGVFGTIMSGFVIIAGASYQESVPSGHPVTKEFAFKHNASPLSDGIDNFGIGANFAGQWTEFNGF